MRIDPGATVAVLGTGIMGSSVALFLARRGVRVVMFDQSTDPFCGASRYNEGKIHLGYLYGADPSLATARRLVPGGLAFASLVRELVNIDLEPLTTRQDDRYVVHRHSVVDLDQVHAVADRVNRLVTDHPDVDGYLVPLEGRRPRRLTASEVAAEYDTDDVTGGIAVAERSVATIPVADAFVDALRSTASIEVLTEQSVTSVAQDHHGRWTVEARASDGVIGRHGPFSAVVNALWEGRPAIDRTAGLPPPVACTHRYRVSIFATASSDVDVASSVVAVGPFGDVKNYDGRRLYLSWYPAGLLAEGEDVTPPVLPVLDADDEARIATRVFDELGAVIPGVALLPERLARIDVRGGWVYAAGTGPLDRIDSDLHRRDRVGVTRRGTYVSVDTGKYSVAPWLARCLVDDLLA